MPGGAVARLAEAEDAALAAILGAPRLRAAQWVRPKLVAQVRFAEGTRDGKLRHPAFLGLRADKAPLECVREEPAQPLAPPTAPWLK